MSLLTHLNPNAIEDASIEGIKLKDGSITSSKIDSSVASKKYVDDTIASAISASDAMVFKGTIGTGGTSESLPSTAIVGDTYKVIALTTIPGASSYTGAEETAKVGDLIVAISAEPKWIVVPSGDEAIDALVLPITWSDLKAKRDAGSLIPGMQYRITDYTCTTVTRGTKSAGHVFDIIVRADSENKLNEEAYAIQHEGDTYFTNSNLSAWKLWYCLDNDTARFEWADATNGRGVIYRMIDEFGNDIPYDFKNIIYVFIPSFMYNAVFGSYKFIRNSSKDMIINGTQHYGYLLIDGNSEYEYWIKDEVPSLNSMLYDSDGNYAGFGDGYISDISLDDYETYTFGKSEDLTITTKDCYNNTILPCKPYGQSILMLNINTFDSNCYGNVFGSNCHDNKFGSSCHGNKFGSSCHGNKFDSNCYGNVFGSNCYKNSFGDGCYYNTFENECYYNTFGNYCEHNAFKNECHGNTFGNYCSYNSFGNLFSSNSFGDECYHNSFGNRCWYNSFGDYCSTNSLGNNCQSIKFASDSSSASTKYNYYQNNRFGDGCQYIVFTGTGTAGEYAQVRNYNFTQGLSGAGSAYLTVDGIRNLSYEVKVEKDSRGTLKMYCLADMIMFEISENDNPYSYPDSTQYIGEI